MLKNAIMRYQVAKYKANLQNQLSTEDKYKNALHHGYIAPELQRSYDNLDFVKTRKAEEQRNQLIEQNKMLRDDFTNLADAVTALSTKDQIKPANKISNFLDEIYGTRPETIPEQVIDDPTIIASRIKTKKQFSRADLDNLDSELIDLLNKHTELKEQYLTITGRKVELRETLNSIIDDFVNNNENYDNDDQLYIENLVEEVKDVLEEAKKKREIL